ncbi:MAG TPA: hypothetical protein VK566_04825 [Nitrososphaeraceae archaeon]|jgi:hypothetical protein|nr:hypothetical protein [Nitrososphaeraceae archaeon]
MAKYLYRYPKKKTLKLGYPLVQKNLYSRTDSVVGIDGHGFTLVALKNKINLD